ncbi:hypothetical protein [Limisalsivibrio acetivorans]|uniref:hypothetical protein n=1 Tax=Limisalsivibrio acetivorans TaxID=1304888 RepID=UPI0012DEDEF7|nr:hypothetical protein [Limisalsivibrio acetivorans]
MTLSIHRNNLIEDSDGEFDTCGARFMFSFLNNTKRPDTTCLEGVIMPDFSGGAEHSVKAAQTLFLRDSVWD